MLQSHLAQECMAWASRERNAWLYLQNILTLLCGCSQLRAREDCRGGLGIFPLCGWRKASGPRIGMPPSSRDQSDSSPGIFRLPPALGSYSGTLRPRGEAVVDATAGLRQSLEEGWGLCSPNLPTSCAPSISEPVCCADADWPITASQTVQCKEGVSSVVTASDLRSGQWLWADVLLIPRTGREVVPLDADGLRTNLRSLGALALQTKPQHRI